MEKLQKYLGKDPKTTLTGVVGALAVILAKFGFDMGADIQGAIVLLTMVVIGFLAKDKEANGSKTESQ